MQGITEFLPISSSGHLVILQGLLGQEEPSLLFAVMLHVGTLVAIFIVFRESIAEIVREAFGLLRPAKGSSRADAWMPVAVIVGCLPTAVIGVVFADWFKRLFASSMAAGVGLMITGVILMSTSWRNGRNASKGGTPSEKDTPKAKGQPAGRIGVGQALVIGTAQGLAIIPGISRSGTTIAVALLLGIERELAARFSFILAIPAVLGALAFELKDYFPIDGAGGGAEAGAVGVAPMLLGAAAAAAVGIIALKLLLGIVRKGKISLFAYYCWALGLLVICVGIFKG